MIVILRLGHRLKRDERVSTHCGLVSRALGSSKIIFSGEHDQKILDTLNSVTKRWGGLFDASYNENWKRVIKDHKTNGFLIVHLTMYGESIQNKIKDIRKKRNILVVVGSEKVPYEIYTLSDFNISVTQQPHSEVAALSIFLHEYFEGKELSKNFKKAKIKIIPQSGGKKTVIK